MVDARRVGVHKYGESPIAAQRAVSHGLDAFTSHTGCCEADDLMAMKLFGRARLLDLVKDL
jgi:hypothetical protein